MRIVEENILILNERRFCESRNRSFAEIVGPIAQEAGRAGRDGKEAYAILLYHRDTIKIQRFIGQIRTSVPGQSGIVGDRLVGVVVDEQKGKPQREAITFGGTVTQERAEWTVTPFSVRLIGGFLPIPKGVRGIYPPCMPGKGRIAVLSGLWYENAEKLWLWLDRAHHRLYGPDLLVVRWRQGRGDRSDP